MRSKRRRRDAALPLLPPAMAGAAAAAEEEEDEEEDDDEDEGSGRSICGGNTSTAAAVAAAAAAPAEPSLLPALVRLGGRSLSAASPAPARFRVVGASPAVAGAAAAAAAAGDWTWHTAFFSAETSFSFKPYCVLISFHNGSVALCGRSGGHGTGELGFTSSAVWTHLRGGRPLRPTRAWSLPTQTRCCWYPWWQSSLGACLAGCRGCWGRAGSVPLAVWPAFLLSMCRCLIIIMQSRG